MTMSDMDIGQVATVTGIQGTSDLAHRLDDLGLSVGSTLRLVRTGPFQGPLLVENLAGGFRVALARDLASNVEIRRKNDPLG